MSSFFRFMYLHLSTCQTFHSPACLPVHYTQRLSRQAIIPKLSQHLHQCTFLLMKTRFISGLTDWKDSSNRICCSPQNRTITRLIFAYCITQRVYHFIWFKNTPQLTTSDKGTFAVNVNFENHQPLMKCIIQTSAKIFIIALFRLL
jgi:hypothetical protein